MGGATLFKRGRYCCMKFKWEGILIRESTRDEDLQTAAKIRRSKLAIEREKRLRIGVAAEVEEALLADIKGLKAKPSPVERALTAGQEKTRKRIEKMKDKLALRKLGIKPT